MSSEPKPVSTLERIGETPELRHVPPREVVVRRLDVEFRRKLTILWDSVAALDQPSDTDLHAAFEDRVRYIIRWLDRLAHLARGPYNPPHGNLREQLLAAVDGAVSAVNATDANAFRRRTPFHLFDRSRGELIYGAFVVIESAIASLTEQLSRIDPSLYEKLLNGDAAPQLYSIVERAATPETAITEC